MKVGFASCRDAYLHYKELIENLSFCTMSNDEIIEILTKDVSSSSQEQWNNCIGSFDSCKKEI